MRFITIVVLASCQLAFLLSSDCYAYAFRPTSRNPKTFKLGNIRVGNVLEDKNGMMQRAYLRSKFTLSARGGASASLFTSPLPHRVLSVTSSTSSLPSSSASTSKLFVAGGSAASETEWTKPRLHNSPLFRSFAILAALSLAGFSSNSPLSRIPTKISAIFHLLSFATWFGTSVYTTFIAGITMFQVLPRKTFGKLQSKLFPKYFNLSSISILLQVLTLRHVSILQGSSSSKIALGVSLTMTLLNQFYLEPKATKIMFDRYELDDVPGAGDTEEYKKLRSSFGKLHGMSSLANLIALCGGVMHGVNLSSALV